MSENGGILDALESMRGEQRQAHQHLAAKLDRVETILTGGNEPAKGIIVRVDRLEQTEDGRKWWQRGLLGGVLTAVGLAIWNAITKGGHS